MRTAILVFAATLVGLAAIGCSSDSKPSSTATATVGTSVTPRASATSGPAGTTTAAVTPSPAASGSLKLTSTAFAEGAPIPVIYTCSGASTSPPLAWSGVPAGTSAFALIVDDPDAPLPGGFVHWVVFNLSPDTTELPAGATLPPQASSGNNGRGTREYLGPCPPVGSADHHYRFHLYALDTPLNLPPGSSKDDVAAATAGHVLGDTVLTGTFKR